MTTIGDTLAWVLPHLPAALVAPSAAARVHALAGTLPAALSHCIYVECRPFRSESADLIIDIDAAAGAILAGANPAIALSAAQQAAPRWAPVIRFARAWTDPEGTLRDSISGAWLEFDLAPGTGTDDAGVAPSLFVDLNDAGSEDARVEHRLAPILDVLVLTGQPASAAACAMLHAAVGLLPHGASIVYAGVMLARPMAATRLCVMGLSRKALGAYLRALGWPGDVAHLGMLMETLARDDGGVHEQPLIVHLDIGESTGGAIGLEYAMARGPQLGGRIAETGLLGTLVGWGLLTPGHVAALHSWTGFSTRTLAHELWPSVIARRVNHVKLVVSDIGTCEVKLYLCAEATPRAELRAGPGPGRRG